MKKSRARILIEDFEENQKALDQLLKAYGNMVTKIKDQDNTKYFKDDQGGYMNTQEMRDKIEMNPQKFRQDVTKRFDDVIKNTKDPFKPAQDIKKGKEE